MLLKRPCVRSIRKSASCPDNKEHKQAQRFTPLCLFLHKKRYRYANLDLAKAWCDMGKSKNYYDSCISSGKRYSYKTRAILFALTMISFVLNLSIIAIFDDTLRKVATLLILPSLLLAVVQFVDNRKSHWTWTYIIILCATFFLLSTVAVFVTELTFIKYVWIVELVVICGFVFTLLKKK